MRLIFFGKTCKRVKHKSFLLIWEQVLILFVLFNQGSLLSYAFAQISAEEHASHHPGGVTPPPSAEPSAAQAGPNIGGQGMMQGMGEMMKGMMGIPPKKDFYPSLVEIPILTADQRTEIQQTADVRTKEGLGQLSQALELLMTAIETDNSSLMQQSLAEMKQGMQRAENGLSAKRLLAEGESPQNIALNWFKTEMNLQKEVELHPQVFFGLSLFHTLVMILLSLFSVMMILMYFFKMRRATALLERLTAEGVGVLPPTSPKDDGGSGGGTPTSGGGTIASAESSSANSASSANPAAKSELKIKETWAGKLKINKIYNETANVKTFQLTDPSGKELPFTYLPGQFLTLAALIEGKKVSRSYTIASSPTNNSFYELTIKREEQGVFSRYLHDLIKEGDLIEARGPGGVFVFTGNEAKSIVLIGAGVGITPLISVIRFLSTKSWDGKIILLFSCRTPGDYLFRQELEELQKKTPNFKVLVTMTRFSEPNWSGMRGRFTKEMIATNVPEIASSRVHICGPVAFMDQLKKILNELNVPKELIKIESFGSLRKDEPVNPLGRDGKQSIVSTATTVTFSLSGKNAALTPSMTVLEASESVGVNIYNSCRAGTCGECKVRLLSGNVSMEIQDSLSEEDKKAGLILACQAKATENITVEA